MTKCKTRRRRGKGDVLTEEDMASFTLNPFWLKALTDFEKESGLDKSQIRIQEWGCGRGRAVARLREMGHAAFGVDIDGRPLAKAG